MATVNELIADTTPSVLAHTPARAAAEPARESSDGFPKTDRSGRLEAVACRVAVRARAEVLPRVCACIDEPTFREEGGNDETLELLASLAVGRVFERDDAAIAVAHEFGIAIPEEDPGERESALTRLVSKLGPLVERVYEIARDTRPTEADLELAASLAARAPGRMYAQQAAAVQHTERDVRSRRGLPPPPEDFLEQRIAAQMATVSAGSWRFLLVDILAEQLKIPESARYRLIEHPALEPALALLTEHAAASPAEIERWRPQLRFDATTEQTALKIAVDARRIAFTDTLDWLGRSEPDLPPDQATAKANAIVDDDPAGWGLNCIDAAARKLLDESVIEPRYHPAALRAEQLIPGLMSSYEALIYDRSMTPRDAANEVIGGVQRATARNRVGAPPPGLSGVPRAASAEPPLFVTTTLEVGYLTGHPGLRPSKQSRWLIMTNTGATVFANPRAKRPLALIEYGKLRALRIEAADRDEPSSGAARRRARGRFAFAAGRRAKLAYLVFEPTEGDDVIFEVPDTSPSQLTGILAPLLRWFEQRSSDSLAA